MSIKKIYIVKLIDSYLCKEWCLKNLLEKRVEFWKYKCPKCEIELDPYAYEITGALFYYKCNKCRHEEHPGY